MKYKLSIIVFLIASIIYGQSNVRQITCLGEVVKDVDTEQITSNSKDTGTIFTIDENDKTIKVKTATRYQGVFLDEFYYEDFMESPYAKIYTCYRNGDYQKTKYFISILSDKMTLMTGNKIIETKIISDRKLVDENYEDLSTEMPNKRIGIVNGTNVNIRNDHSTNSQIIGSFINTGEKVQILGTYIDEKTQALVERDIRFSINDKDFELKKGKALKLIDEKPDYFTVSFKDDNSKDQIAKIQKQYVSVSNLNKWYNIKRENGTTGWVFGKFINE